MARQPIGVQSGFPDRRGLEALELERGALSSRVAP
jgi:hypothetical protein